MKVPVLMVLAACGPELAPAAPAQTTSATAPTCAEACAHARELGCEVGLPTDAGTTCEEVCGTVEGLGLDEARWPIACVLSATTCDQADLCQ